MTALLLASAVATALVAGIFFAFSTFVMAALGRLAPASGIAAMQAINVVVLNPLFFLSFFGAGVLCLVAAAAVLLTASDASVALVLAGAALYIVGCLGVTIVGNVPLNERLAKVEATAAGSEPLWRGYLDRWTVWNHVRTAASLTAAVALAAAVAAM